jgi:predicted alpha/beta-hydrolase family hydrolase
VLILASLALTGCGGGDDYPDKASAVGPIVKGPKGVWLFQPAGKPKNVVVYFHGQGGPTEATPKNHRPWIDHLVSRGSIVVYPRWELNYEIDPVVYALQGVQTAMKRVENADKLPVLALGYSRGGAMAVEYAAVAPGNDAPVPDQVISVFPAGQGNERRSIDLSTLDPSTRLLIQIGTEDTVVDGAGARYLLGRLQRGGFPGENIKVDVVRSKIGFSSDHFAPLGTSALAQAAFWAPADRALDRLE